MKFLEIPADAAPATPMSRPKGRGGAARKSSFS